MTRASDEVLELVAGETPAVDDLLSEAANIVCREAADVCVISILPNAGGRLHPLGVAAGDPGVRAALEDILLRSAGALTDFARPVVMAGAARVYSGEGLARALEGDPRLAQFLEQTRIATAMVVGMRALDQRPGLMAVGRRQGSPAFSEAAVPIVQTIADLLGLAIANIHLQEELQRIHESGHDELPDPRLRKLTPRELEILRLIGEGLTSREIGERLYLSSRTVEWHRARLSAKLGEHSRSALIALGRTLHG